MPVEISGPLFDGRAEREIEDACREVNTEVANKVISAVRTRLGLVLKNPTGNYESHIRTERQQDDMQVNDSGIVYGPWLEGVSSRNQSTRFKGYATFRIVYQQESSKAGGIATSIVARHVGKMN
jgi:hypothetical protein